MTVNLESKSPAGPIADKWDNYKANLKLVNPNNKRKFKVLIVGSGLAGASAAATMAELGYDVEVFTFHDSPRRAHSIAAQGGINAAKNYRGDGDSIYRLFYDTIKGGDFRSREANVYRLAQVSVNIIDQMVAQGVPFAREYGGLLDTRSFGGAQLQRTFYARGQTGQQLLLGAYQQLARQIGLGGVKLWNRVEMLDVVTVDGRAAGIVTRDLVTGEIRSHAGHAVVLATGGYGNVFFLSTNAMACNVTAAWRAHRKGAAFANPCYTQIHPTCIPQADDTQSKLTLMSESLRNDGRVWVPSAVGDERHGACYSARKILAGGDICQERGERFGVDTLKQADAGAKDDAIVVRAPFLQRARHVLRQGRAADLFQKAQYRVGLEACLPGLVERFTRQRVLEDMGVRLGARRAEFEPRQNGGAHRAKRQNLEVGLNDDAALIGGRRRSFPHRGLRALVLAANGREAGQHLPAKGCQAHEPPPGVLLVQEAQFGDTHLQQRTTAALDDKTLFGRVDGNDKVVVARVVAIAEIDADIVL